MEARAEAKFVRISPQKARLVVDLIRGRRAEDALQILQFTRKRIAGDVAKVLRSAIANATHQDDQLDVDQLFVVRAYVNDGPRLKRIRPAPMGRAYHYQRRLAHIAVHVGDRAVAEPKLAHVVGEPEAAAAPTAPAKRPARQPAPKKKPVVAKKKPAAGKAKTKPAAKPAAKPKPRAKPAAKPKSGGKGRSE